MDYYSSHQTVSSNIILVMNTSSLSKLRDKTLFVPHPLLRSVFSFIILVAFSMNSTQPNIVRVSWDFFVHSALPVFMPSRPFEGSAYFHDIPVGVFWDKSRSRLVSLFPNLRPWEMNGRWGVRSGLAWFKDKKCLSFVLKVNAKTSVRSIYHNCPECLWRCCPIRPH